MTKQTEKAIRDLRRISEKLNGPASHLEELGLECQTQLLDNAAHLVDQVIDTLEAI